MTGAEPIAAIGAHQPSANVREAAGAPNVAPSASTHFGDMLGEGLSQVEHRIQNADRMVRAFALDSSIPIHDVTIAIEEARLAVELALQVRTRLVEGYREIMNMQL